MATSTLPTVPRFRSALIALVSALTIGIAGCTSELDSQSEPEAEFVDTDDEFRDGLVAAISTDWRFQQLLEISIDLTAQRAAAQFSMTDEDLDAYATTIGQPGYHEVVDFPTFLQASGVDPSIVIQQRDLILELIDAYDLQGLTGAQLNQLFHAATTTAANKSFIEGAIEYEIHDLEGEVDTTIDDCEAACIATYAVTASSALATYVATLAAATAAGPAAAIIVATATATYFIALANAEGAKDNCFAICHGEEPSDQECDRDSDCDNDEFCWKGVAGIGKNECRPLKDEDQTCSRHGQCDSGCCKLHFWTNPVSKTCRPASACD